MRGLDAGPDGTAAELSREREFLPNRSHQREKHSEDGQTARAQADTEPDQSAPEGQSQADVEQQPRADQRPRQWRLWAGR